MNFKRPFLSVLVLALTSTFFAQDAAAELLQTPINVSTAAVAPNLMFTLDDSGSMMFECVPDNLCSVGNEVGAFPDLNGAKLGVATGNTTFALQMRLRSTQTNSIYYDPAIVYKPWIKKDGTRYPNSVPTAARSFPESATITDTINLVADQALNTNWCQTTLGTARAWTCAQAIQTKYWATYFDYIGTDPTKVESYAEVKISSGKTFPRGTGPKASSRTDCAGTRCNFVEEAQNFANFYSYHRTRMRVAIAGTSEAFFTLPETMRVGYGRINKSSTTSIDGHPTRTIERGVRPFDLSASGNKSAFFDWIVQRTSAAGDTPLRRAISDVGEYYSYTDSKGPWGEIPGTTSTTPGVACRRAYHVMMTDGSWNSAGATNPAATGNIDGTTGPLITGPGGQTFTYQPDFPFTDEQPDSLADAAMYYWNRDLNSALPNAVRPTSADPAFWQHMVNFGVAFGVDGVLPVATSLPGLTDGSIQWPTVGPLEKANIDDLWHATINSRGRFLSAKNTTEYSEALKALIFDIVTVNGNASGVAVSSKTVGITSNTRKYEPTFSSAFWSGDVQALNLDRFGNPTTTAWSAAEVLPSPTTRNIVAVNAAATSLPKAVPFTWASLTNAMKLKFFGSTSGGEGVLAFLRGDRTGEGSTYRKRASAIGDIVNSSPVLIKDLLDLQYDFLASPTQAAAYRRFLVAKSKRVGQLFVGANDGMLHAFADSTGAETFAMIPDGVLGRVKNLADTSYGHEYFVDGPLTEADIWDAGSSKWRSLAIGGTGAGGQSMFAVSTPVPNYPATATAPPATLSTSASSSTATDVLWEVQPSTAGFEDMGSVLSIAEHGVMKDGTWVVIFGNGFESANKKAVLYIVNAMTGALIKSIDTGVGSAASVNGLGGVRVVRDAQRQIVAAYAGDLQGNMWKFDFSSASRSNWIVAFGATGGARNPLFKTTTPEPITAAPTFIVHPSGGVMVLFGSGKIFAVGDVTDTGVRALYGIWDRVAIGASSSSAADRVSNNNLIIAQAFDAAPRVTDEATFFELTVTPVDYGTNRGWRLPLTIGAGQRLVDDPEISVGRVFMQTVAPIGAASSCSGVSVERAGFALDPFMNSISKSTLDTNSNDAINTGDRLRTVGLLLNDNGPSSLVRRAGRNRALILSSGGQSVEFEGAADAVRRYWRHIVTQP